MEAKKEGMTTPEKSKHTLLLFFMVLAFSTPLHKPASAMETLTTSISKEFKNGLSETILTAIAAKLERQIIIINAPFKRRLYLMKNGTIDLMAGLLKRPEREAYIHYINPPYKKRSDTVFIVLKGKRSQIKCYDDLKCLRIGCTIGSSYFHRFDNDSNLTKEVVPKGSFNFRKLLHNRLDTTAISESTGIDLIHRMGIARQVEIADFRFSEVKHVYIGISKKSPIIKHLPRIEAVIKELVASGELTTIITHYYTSRNLPVPAL